MNKQVRETMEIIKQEYYLNLLEQIGILKVIYLRYMCPIDFTILTADYIYGWTGYHLEDYGGLKK